MTNRASNAMVLKSATLIVCSKMQKKIPVLELGEWRRKKLSSPFLSIDCQEKQHLLQLQQKPLTSRLLHLKTLLVDQCVREKQCHCHSPSEHPQLLLYASLTLLSMPPAFQVLDHKVLQKPSNTNFIRNYIQASSIFN